MIPFCPGIILEAAVDPSFSTTEKKLVCGDPTPGDLAWRQIPASQARFFFRNFLQARGYHQPEFAQKEGVLHVTPGKRATVTAVRTRLQSDLASVVALELDRNRKMIGEILNPAFLDRLERWTYGRLQNLGYPCPSVTSQADPLTGAVVLNLDPGPQLPLKKVEEDRSLPELLPGTLRRFDAFEIGKLFQGDLLSVTEKRVTSSQVVQNIHLSVDRCEPDGAVIQQKLTPGFPRLLSFGFGANTEGILLGRASWKNSRLGDQASSFEVQATASFLRQDLSALVRWFYLPQPSRLYFRPSLSFSHQNEASYEVFSTTTHLDQATTWDFSTPWTSMGMAAAVRAGPKFEYVNTIRGTGPKSSTFLSLEGMTTLNSHTFEFFQFSPRSGFLTNLDLEINHRGILSPVTAQRLNLNGEILVNYHEYDPPLWIFGIRGGIATTFTEDRYPYDNLPPNYRRYLGGSADLRGFGRLELPLDGKGSLSSFFLGLETRTGPLLPLGIAPYLFLDLGLLGNEPLSFDRTLYWSPGLGLRWESAIGAIRASAAHGYIAGLPRDSGASHSQFYLSLGEEF